MSKKPLALNDPQANPFHPINFTYQEACAIKAVHEGNASPEQQRIAMAVIVYKVSNKEDLSYRPNSDATIFAEGRRFVGLQLSKAINHPAEIWKKDDEQ